MSAAVERAAEVIERAFLDTRQGKMRNDWVTGEEVAEYLADTGLLLSDADQLADRVDVQGDCWVWNGKPNSEGYGRFYSEGTETKAHRHVYETLVGPIPDGLHLDHLCRNRRCVNPDHLEPVPPRTNYLRGFGPTAENARKSTCAQGHPFTPENTITKTGGRRACRTCQREQDRTYRAAKRRGAS